MNHWMRNDNSFYLVKECETNDEIQWLNQRFVLSCESSSYYYYYSSIEVYAV